MSRSVSRPPALLPDGVRLTLRDQKEEVGSILGMDTWLGQGPDVMKSSPGSILIVCSLAIPLLHYHDMMNQKPFWRLRAPLVM
jgi:hypothetical protein